MRLFDAKTLNLLKCFDSERPLNSACLSPLANCPYIIAGGGQDAMSVTTTSSKQGKVRTHPCIPSPTLAPPHIPSHPLTSPHIPSHPLTHLPPAHPHTPHTQFEAVIFDHVYDDELASITGHFGPINTLAFAPHGRSYASGGEDGYVRITHFPEDYFDAFSKKTAEAFGRPWPEKK